MVAPAGSSVETEEESSVSLSRIVRAFLEQKTKGICGLRAASVEILIHVASSQPTPLPCVDIEIRVRPHER